MIEILMWIISMMTIRAAGLGADDDGGDGIVAEYDEGRQVWLTGHAGRNYYKQTQRLDASVAPSSACHLGLGVQMTSMSTTKSTSPKLVNLMSMSSLTEQASTYDHKVFLGYVPRSKQSIFRSPFSVYLWRYGCGIWSRGKLAWQN